MSSRRVLRGGSSNDVFWRLRTTIRSRLVPVSRSWNLGFRLVIKRRKP